METFLEILVLVCVICFSFGFAANFLIPIFMGVTTVYGTIVFGLLGIAFLALGIISIVGYFSDNTIFQIA